MGSAATACRRHISASDQQVKPLRPHPEPPALRNSCTNLQAALRLCPVLNQNSEEARVCRQHANEFISSGNVGEAEADCTALRMALRHMACCKVPTGRSTAVQPVDLGPGLHRAVPPAAPVCPWLATPSCLAEAVGKWFRRRKEVWPCRQDARVAAVSSRRAIARAQERLALRHSPAMRTLGYGLPALSGALLSRYCPWSATSKPQRRPQRRPQHRPQRRPQRTSNSGCSACGARPRPADSAASSLKEARVHSS